LKGIILENNIKREIELLKTILTIITTVIAKGYPKH